MLNRECCNSITISPESFVNLTSLKNLKCTPTFLHRSVGRRVGRRYSFQNTRPVECKALQRLHRQFHYQCNRQLLSQNLLQLTKNIKRGNQGSTTKILNEQKCCVYAVKLFVGMNERVYSTSSAPNL